MSFTEHSPRFTYEVTRRAGGGMWHWTVFDRQTDKSTGGLSYTAWGGRLAAKSAADRLRRTGDSRQVLRGEIK